MRRAARFASVFASAGLGLVAHATGCFPYNTPDDCEHRFINCEAAAGGGGGGVAAAGCVPSASEAPVDDACGVFVSASVDGAKDDNPGTKAAPVASLAAAIARAGEAGTRRVYACAETFDKAIEVTAGVTLYGGLDCTDSWRWVGETKKTTLTAAAGEVPLAVRGAEADVRIEDVQIVARSIDAEDPALRGASSIAAIADRAAVSLARCVLEAGDGAPGIDGEAHGTSAKSGDAGNTGNAACSASQILGGDPQVNDCGTPDDATDDSIGGVGGVGTASSGGPGGAGSPGPDDNGGTGEGTVACTQGTAGADGVPGEAGAGAAGIGALSSEGFAGTPGHDGGRGTIAQGGGGGGGSKGGTGTGRCGIGSAGGASGGSGGAGGCGGLGGHAGGPGGASIGLVSLGATLRFEAVTVKTGNGARGGAGAAGQPGGSGGNGGDGGLVPAGSVGLRLGCLGGRGGNGGNGGNGGGGLGGHAIGVAFRGAMPPMADVAFQLGDAGEGGTATDPQYSGAAGTAAAAQEFP